MRNPDDEGFITLHRGRMPVLLQVVAALAMACALVFFWKVTKAPATTKATLVGSSYEAAPKMNDYVIPVIPVMPSGSFSSGAISMGTIIQGRCASGRIPVIVGADMTAPCTGGICPLMVYKCAVPADLTDQE